MAAHPTRVLPPHLVVILLVLGLAAPVGAQRAVISVGALGLPPATDLIDIPTGTVTRLANDVTDKAVFLSDGMVLLRRRSGDRTWRARFMDSGVEIAMPAGFEESFIAHAPLPIAHPREPALFGMYTDPTFSRGYPARLDAAGLHVWTPCEGQDWFAAYDLTPDGRFLFVACAPLGLGSTTVTVLDATTGAVVRQVPVPATYVVGIALGTDGREMVIADAPPLGSVVVSRLDASTGALRQQVTIASPTSTAPKVVANPRRRDTPLLVRCIGGIPGECQTHVLDFATLTLGAEVHARRPGPARFGFSSDGGQVIVAGGDFVSRVDAVTGTVLNFASAPAGGFIIAAWGAEPQAPVLAPPVVVGNAVALSWTLPVESTAVTGYRLEAGSQPGLADVLTTALGPTPSFAASGVPPGRYYVRMRALNGNGASTPSNEIVVNVP